MFMSKLPAGLPACMCDENLHQRLNACGHVSEATRETPQKRSGTNRSRQTKAEMAMNSLPPNYTVTHFSSLFPPSFSLSVNFLLLLPNRPFFLPSLPFALLPITRRSRSRTTHFTAFKCWREILLGIIQQEMNPLVLFTPPPLLHNTFPIRLPPHSLFFSSFLLHVAPLSGCSVVRLPKAFSLFSFPCFTV